MYQKLIPKNTNSVTTISKRFNSSSAMDMYFFGTDFFNVGSGQDGQQGKARKQQVEANVKEIGQFNNFYSLQHLNQDREVTPDDLDASTGQIKVTRGYRHPFDYDTNNLNLTPAEYYTNRQALVGGVFYSPDEVSTFQTSWPLLAFFSVWGMNQQLTPAGVWLLEYFGNYNFLFFGFLGKCFMVPWILFNLFKPFYLGNQSHDLIEHEIDTFFRGLNDAFIDATLEEKQHSVEQMQQLELLDLYPTLRTEFYKELKLKEEHEFKAHAETRVKSMLDHAVKFEAANFAEINNQILTKALSALDKAVQGNNVQKESLDSALATLRSIGKKGSAEVNDPLAKAVISALKEFSSELDKLSPEERDRMIALTQMQVEQLKSMDASMQEKQLKTKVEVHDESIVSNPVYKEVVAKML